MQAHCLGMNSGYSLVGAPTPESRWISYWIPKADVTAAAAAYETVDGASGLLVDLSGALDL